MTTEMTLREILLKAQCPDIRSITYAHKPNTYIYISIPDEFYPYKIHNIELNRDERTVCLYFKTIVF